MIVRDSSNTKVTAKAGQKLFSFSISRQANRKRARVRRCFVSVNGFVTVSRGLVTLLSFARVSLVLCVSLSLCVSVSRSRGKCPASDGLKRTERGESHGSERESARAFERVVPRYPCLLSLNLFRYEYALVRLCGFQCGLSAPGVSKCRPPRNIAQSCGYI